MNESKTINLKELNDGELQALYINISLQNRVNEQTLLQIANEILLRVQQQKSQSEPTEQKMILPKLKKVSPVKEEIGSFNTT